MSVEPKVAKEKKEGGGSDEYNESSGDEEEEEKPSPAENKKQKGSELEGAVLPPTKRHRGRRRTEVDPNPGDDSEKAETERKRLVRRMVILDACPLSRGEVKRMARRGFITRLAPSSIPVIQAMAFSMIYKLSEIAMIRRSSAYPSDSGGRTLMGRDVQEALHALGVSPMFVPEAAVKKKKKTEEEEVDNPAASI